MRENRHIKCLNGVDTNNKFHLWQLAMTQKVSLMAFVGVNDLRSV